MWSEALQLKENIWDPYMGLEEKMATLRRKMGVLISRRDDIKGEADNAEAHPLKRRKTEVDHWLCSIEKLELEFERFDLEVEQSSMFSRIWLSNRADNIHKEVEDLLNQGTFSESICLNVNDEKLLSLVTKDIKGQAFVESVTKVLMCLNEVSSIGIYGMGGVGKTTLAMHIHNHLLKDSRFRGNVYWITVSQDFSITKLQNDIAKSLGLDLSSEDDDKKRASMLFHSLKRKESFVLVLDDVWTSFDVVEEVGIPLETGLCKLIITSRSVEVCKAIGCKRNLKVQTLPMAESWELFVQTLDFCGDLPTEIELIARKMTKKCDGLPLGLITVAASMKGVEDVFEWGNAYEEFVESCMQMGYMNDKVFLILRYSYNRLREPTLQKCFLYCCLYPEDFKIYRDDLIHLFIVEGLLEKRRSRHAYFIQGNAVLNKLERACLLESVVNEKCVRMHDLVREMALHIARSEFKWMIKAGAQLRELPGDEEWSEDLEKVSLMNNDVRKISVGLSQACPRLTTLSLQGNGLTEIVDPFFMQMLGLRVLDLSNTAIQQLPSSVSNLESLSALLLRSCRQLRFVSPLNKLTKLIELDLSDTSIEEVPQGIESLVNLKSLDMRSIEELKAPAVDILARLSNLQVLLIPFVVRVEDLQGMRQLEVFCGQFVDVCSFNRFVKHHRHTCGNPVYDIVLDPEQSVFLGSYEIHPNYKQVELKHFVLSGHNVEMLCHDEIEGGERDVILLPPDTQKLTISKSEFRNSGNSFLDAIPALIQSRDLKEIGMEECNGIEYLMRLSNCSLTGERMMGDHGLTSTCKPFQSLEILRLENLKDFTGLCKLESGQDALPPVGTFSNLRRLHVSECHTMKTVIPAWLLQYLLNLNEIYVVDCKEMEEIITENEEEEEVNQCSSSALSLHKLQRLCLTQLPQLKSIYRGRMICASIQRIRVQRCPKVKRLPFTLPFRDGQPSAPPALQCIQMRVQEWESLQWDHPHYKNVLQPFFSKIMNYDLYCDEVKFSTF